MLFRSTKRFEIIQDNITKSLQTINCYIEKDDIQHYAKKGIGVLLGVTPKNETLLQQLRNTRHNMLAPKDEETWSNQSRTKYQHVLIEQRSDVKEQNKSFNDPCLRQTKRRTWSN